MLQHPWLKMADNYNFKMSDLEFKKYTLKTTIQTVNEQALSKDPLVSQLPGFNQPVPECQVYELAESDSDINAADEENNTSSDSGDTDSVSLSGDKDEGYEDEFNLNVSFSGGYVPNTDLTRVDKGQGNPQFEGLDVKV